MGKAAKNIIRFIQRFWPFIVLVCFVGIFSLPYITKGRIPFPSKYLVTFFAPWNASYGMPVKNNAMPDVITQIYPWKQLTIDAWKQGYIPLWNPYAFAGTAHAGNYQTAVFSPMNLLFFILPFIDAWSFMILLQPLFAAFGTYLFLRALDRSKVASLIGSIGFMFCGFITTWMAYGTLGYAALMLPFILWSIVINFKKHSVLSRLMLPVFVAISFLSGHFQISLYVCIAAILFISFEGLQKRNWKEVVRSLLGLLIGVGIAAPQLLLTYHAYVASTRTDSFIRSEIIPWSYLITLFSPDFYGNPVTRNDWFGHYAEWGSYVGIVPLMLSIIALCVNLKGYKKYFLILIGLVIALAFPTPIADLLFFLKFPILSTSAASRIIFILSFAVVALASFGCDELIVAWKEKNKKLILRLVIGCIVFLAIVWIVLLGMKLLPVDKLVIAKRNFVLPTAFALVVLTIVTAGLTGKKKLQTIFLVGLLGLSMFDMYRYATKWMPFEERKYMYPESSSIAFLKKNIDFNRVFGNIGGEVGNTYKLPLIEGYDAMYRARYGEFINASSKGIVAPAGRSVVQFDKSGRFNTDVLQLLAVRYIYQRKSDGRNVWAFPVWQYSAGDMVKRFEDEYYEVYEYTHAYPRAFLASSYVVRRDPQEIIDTLFRKDFDKRNILVLEEEPNSKPEQGEGIATIEKYEANRVVIQTNSPAPKLLFLSDVYDAGWEATIDGKKTKIYRADYDFRAVGVPAGVHTIEYRYRPKGFRI
ncbi:MAG: hypothetical protein UT26_C0003G0007 [Microgenomates group bacterium GW2011_GWC1_39_12]|nr:MAG: hypothetical protein UT26_C0003G0007 [Microgenomates group bacterium GW2011_GWC1_39_12]